MNSIFAPFLLLGPSFFAETSGPGMHPVGGGGGVDQLPLGARRGTAQAASGRGLDEGDHWGGVGGQGGHRKGDLRQTEPGKILGTSPTKLGV